MRAQARGEIAPVVLPAHARDEVALTLDLSALTPIYKGGTNPRGIDLGRPFRGPSIRGQLRFWWRATSALTDVAALRAAEKALWGGIFQGPLVASRVRVGLTDLGSEPVAKSEIAAYALWVVRPQLTDARPFHKAGAHGKLRVSCPSACAPEIRRAVAAWLLFGGVGSRSRRGLGAVWDKAGLLGPFPDAAALIAAARALVPVRVPAGVQPRWPTLEGARLVIGPTAPTAEKAWTAALGLMQALRCHPTRSTVPGAVRPLALGADFPAIARGLRDFTSARAALGLPLYFRWQEGQVWAERTVGPRGLNRVPSPVLLRPVPVGAGFVPILLALSAPLPPDPTVEVRERQTKTGFGKIDPRGVDLFLSAAAATPGWSLHALAPARQP